jgi:hypothetical protein
MATIYRCDKCERDGKQRALSIVNVSTGDDVHDVAPVRLELCVGCVQRLKEWLRPDAKEARKACECGGVRR